ncbi:hydratase [Piscinibacter sp. Jin2]|uniref:Hydratase n=1 Tax=Aquariibacter lacus TaxID=2801332 RepID=A0A9X0XH47_9BURK|nr:hydratase [Piscinibacter lacus]MBL0720787.1 hydratase [Piscinibacter lacus]
MSFDPRAAARSIWAHWQAGTVLDHLPPGQRPSSRAEGYEAQALLPEVAGRVPLGWKLAATSIEGQRHINVSGPLAGRLLGGQIGRDGDTFPLAGNRMRVAEPEFTFHMGRDLPPRASDYTVDEVMAAVASLHPSIELPDSRFADFTVVGEAQLLADNACAGRYALGDAPEPGAGADWRSLDLAAHRVRGQVFRKVDGEETCVIDREGQGANVLDDPRLALTWLVNELSALGLGLGRRSLVTTGTCMKPLAIAPGDRVEVDFGVLGRVGLKLAPEAG